MPRGFVWAVYVDDDGGQWGLLVDADYVQDADRGWITDGAETLFPMPRQWLPRKVIGIDELGRTQYAIAGSLAAAIWTGLVPTFVFTANDGISRVADITGRLQERRRLPKPE